MSLQPHFFYPVQPPIRVVRLLLVEDCKSDVFLMERMLEGIAVNCFLEITDVPRLIDAFSKIDRAEFDLILLDLNLLDIDGIASIAALRAQAPAIPIVVYSGMDNAKLQEKALLCGATHYLVKGRVNVHNLRAIIEQVAALGAG
jgi:CheY-like chemotaxis protein